MKCYKCGQRLPEDSEFCQYCGAKIEIPIQENIVEHVMIADEATKTTEIAFPDSESVTSTEAPGAIVKIPLEKTEKNLVRNQNEKPIKKRFCKFCGAQIDATNKKCSGCGKQYFNGIKVNKSLIIGLTLSILILTSVILNIVQFIKAEELNATVASQNSTISFQKNKIDSLDEKSGYYDIICRELSYGNVGYAANNFRVNESIIVVDKNETDRKFTLTANWPNGGNVSVSYLGYSAGVSFDNDSWTTSTKMAVNPFDKGVTVVKFSNDVDSRTFKMIIIVKDEI